MNKETKENILLSSFVEESQMLANACRENLHWSISEGGELYADGTKLYRPIDPLIERGLVATARLIYTDEALSFLKIANLVTLRYGIGSTEAQMIKTLKKDFISRTKDHKEIFDRAANIQHLHLDINNTSRFKEYVRIKHSCLGPLEKTALYELIQNIADLSTKLSEEFIIPKLSSDPHYLETIDLNE